MLFFIKFKRNTHSPWGQNFIIERRHFNQLSLQSTSYNKNWTFFKAFKTLSGECFHAPFHAPAKQMVLSVRCKWKYAKFVTESRSLPGYVRQIGGMDMGTRTHASVTGQWGGCDRHPSSKLIVFPRKAFAEKCKTSKLNLRSPLCTWKVGHRSHVHVSVCDCDTG